MRENPELRRFMLEALSRSGLRTQSALASAAGLDQSYVSKVINGRTRPEWPTIVRLATALQTPPEELAAVATLPGFVRAEQRRLLPKPTEQASRRVEADADLMARLRKVLQFVSVEEAAWLESQLADDWKHDLNRLIGLLEAAHRRRSASSR